MRPSFAGQLAQAHAADLRAQAHRDHLARMAEGGAGRTRARLRKAVGLRLLRTGYRLLDEPQRRPA